MSDYIKRSEVLAITSPYTAPLIHIDTLKQRINEIPAADVVEVVRCVDCQHLKIINDGKVHAKCKETDFEFMHFGTDIRTHYCGFGKKKAGD